MDHQLVGADSLIALDLSEEATLKGLGHIVGLDKVLCGDFLAAREGPAFAELECPGDTIFRDFPTLGKVATNIVLVVLEHRQEVVVHAVHDSVAGILRKGEPEGYIRAYPVVCHSTDLDPRGLRGDVVSGQVDPDTLLNGN